MRHFSRTGFTDRNGRIWFNPDKYAPISATMDCSFEQPEIVCGGVSEYIVTGTIDCTSMAVTAEWYGHKGILADLTVTWEQPEFAGTGTAELPPNGDIACQFLPPHLEMSSGRGLTCELKPMVFEAYSKYRSNSMDLIFKEFDMWSEGRNDFRSLEPKFEKMTLVMTAGSQLDLELEKPECYFHGVAGLTGRINARMARPDITMIGGPPPYIDATMEKPQLVIYGQSDNVSSFTATMKYPVASWIGDNGLVGLMSVSLRPLRGQFTMDLSHPVGGISGTLGVPRCRMESIGSIDADIVVAIKKIRCEMQAFYDGINSIDVEIPAPTIELTSDTGQDGSCDLTETLTFDEDF